MPKLKSSSGAKKRFRFTKSGKIKRAKAKRRHILTGKPSKRMRLSKQGGLVAKVDSAKIHRLLPYGGR